MVFRVVQCFSVKEKIRYEVTFEHKHGNILGCKEASDHDSSRDSTGGNHPVLHGEDGPMVVVVLGVKRYLHAEDLTSFDAFDKGFACFLIGLRRRLDAEPLVKRTVENVIGNQYIVIFLEHATSELNRRHEGPLIEGIEIMTLNMILLSITVVK